MAEPDPLIEEKPVISDNQKVDVDNANITKQRASATNTRSTDAVKPDTTIDSTPSEALNSVFPHDGQEHVSANITCDASTSDVRDEHKTESLAEDDLESPTDEKAVPSEDLMELQKNIAGRFVGQLAPSFSPTPTSLPANDEHAPSSDVCNEDASDEDDYDEVPRIEATVQYRQAPREHNAPGAAPSLQSNDEANGDNDGDDEGSKLGPETEQDKSYDEDNISAAATKGSKKRKSTARKTNPQPSKKAKTKQQGKARQKAKAGAKKGSKKPTKKSDVLPPGQFNVSNLVNNDVFENYNQTANLPDQPTVHISGSREKKKRALESIMDTMGKSGSLDSNKDDITHLKEAISKFHSGGQNVTPLGDGWKVKGMTTALKHYQVVGAGWMRGREEAKDIPRGGILADEMGLGKTLQTIACIVNGKVRMPENAASDWKQTTPKTTLLVVPASLIKQWEHELTTHTHARKGHTYGIDAVFRYKASVHDKEHGRDAIEGFLQSKDIVIVTYHEVGRSYPKITMPAELITAEQKSRYWDAEYDKQKGTLHKIAWQRVVLDEAHTIKNYLGHFSKACRGLTATHRWALTGTPIMNDISEFYAYLKFLRYPYVGSIRTFMANYCNKDDNTGVDRLGLVLRQIMLRRTSGHTMFGARLLSLPKPFSSVCWVRFNSVERKCYEIVKKRFVTRINAISGSADSAERKYSQIWTMLLRLRQLCSHILAIQGTISDLLEREDWEAFKNLCGDQGERDDECVAHLTQLHVMLKASRNPESSDENVERVVHHISQPPIIHAKDEVHDDEWDLLGGTHGQTYDFGKYIAHASQSRGFQEMRKRTTCLACGQPPDKPQVTSCHHIYCENCLQLLVDRASRRGQDSAKCLECNEEFSNAEAVDDSQLGGSTPSPGGGTQKADDDTSDWIKGVNGEVLPSAKTMALKLQIIRWLKEDPDAKIIVFTQFLPLIRILGKVCVAENWGYETYTGKQTLERRAKIIDHFRDSTSCKILLASLKCGGIGLNLTMASRVALLDPWWNNAIEDQSYGRVYRIGQTKESELVRYVVEDTVEDKIMALKERKQIDIDEVMKNRKANVKPSVGELLRLFGSVEEKDGCPFVIPEGCDSDDEDDTASAGPGYVNHEDEDDEEFGFADDE